MSLEVCPVLFHYYINNYDSKTHKSYTSRATSSAKMYSLETTHNFTTNKPGKIDKIDKILRCMVADDSRNTPNNLRILNCIRKQSIGSVLLRIRLIELKNRALETECF